MNFLVCPVCQRELQLEPQRFEQTEVAEGRLRCTRCPREYPIIGGVPRFVQTEAYAASFGREWNWFSTVQLDSASGTRESECTLQESTGWDADDYAGRLVLDAGVGCGRFAEVAEAYGAEVVGVDLSAAVEAAYRNVGRLDNVHIVQADLFALPFRKGTFDLAYSINVLPHTPDPEGAFRRVAATVKTGGAFSVSLDDQSGIGRCVSDAIRVLTTRLPFPLTLALSALAIPYYYVCRVPWLGRLLQLLWPTSMHPDWRWRWLDTFGRYSPVYQRKVSYADLGGWFRDNGFHDMDVLDGAIRMCAVKTGRRPADARPELAAVGR